MRTKERIIELLKEKFWTVNLKAIDADARPFSKRINAQHRVAARRLLDEIKLEFA